MKYLIHYTVGGEEDTVVVQGATVEECRQAAETEVAVRGGSNPWSEFIEGLAKQG